MVLLPWYYKWIFADKWLVYHIFPIKKLVIPTYTNHLSAKIEHKMMGSNGFEKRDPIDE
jgi:hypothetical protein